VTTSLTCSHEPCEEDVKSHSVVDYQGDAYCSKACVKMELYLDDEERTCAAPNCDSTLAEVNGALVPEMDAIACSGACRGAYFNLKTENVECKACGDEFERHIKSNDNTCDTCGKHNIEVEVECNYDYCNETETISRAQKNRMQSNGKDWYCYSVHKRRDKQNIKPVECQYHGCSEHFPVKMETDAHENFDKDHGTYKKHALHENSWKPDPDDKRERFQKHADGEVTEPMPDREMYCTGHLRKRLHQRGRAIEWEKEPDMLVEEQKRSGTPV